MFVTGGLGGQQYVGREEDVTVKDAVLDRVERDEALLPHMCDLLVPGVEQPS
jgi:hypothetical protein